MREALLAYAELLAQHHGKTIRGEHEIGIVQAAERYCRSYGTLSERRSAFEAITAKLPEMFSALSATLSLRRSTGQRHLAAPACTWMGKLCRWRHSTNLPLWPMAPISASWIRSLLRYIGNDSPNPELQTRADRNDPTALILPHALNKTAGGDQRIDSRNQ